MSAASHHRAVARSGVIALVRMKLVPPMALLLAVLATGGCQALVPPEARTPSAVEEDDLTDDQAALLAACNATESDYSDYRFVE